MANDFIDGLVRVSHAQNKTNKHLIWKYPYGLTIERYIILEAISFC